MNVKALRKRFQLSYCWLLLLAAKGFVAQVGTKGYDANVAIMDLLAMHGDEVVAPLNVTPHDFLVLLKETIIPSLTVEHSMTDLLDKINGTPPPWGRGQEDGSSMTTNATCVAMAAAATLLTKQLTAAESAVVQATSHLELMHALVNQACTVADEATQRRSVSNKTLAAARHVHAAAIDTVDIATTDKSQCVAELNALDMDTMATAKNQLALGAQAIF